MMTPNGIEIKVGQRWRELDKRYSSRIVEVLHIDEENKKVVIRRGRTTTASLRRFNGKSGGYELVPND